MRRYAWLLLTAALLTAVVLWQIRQAGAFAEVEVAEARLGPLAVEWSAVAYVEARTARVAAPQVGRVERVLVREGDRVEAGQILAVLERRSEAAAVLVQRAGISQALAAAQAARAAVREAAASQLDRERRVRAEAEAARERWRQAAALLARARRTLPAAVEAARSDLEAARATLRDLERGSRPEELAQAEAEVQAAAATLGRARAEAERNRQLFDEGAASKRDLEASLEALARAEAAHRSRLEALALLRRGAREDVVAAARARVRAAQAALRSAEGEAAGIDAEARREREAAAALRAARAAVSEARAGRERVAALRAEVRAAEARVRQGRAAMDQAAAVLGERAVRAPFRGVVGRRHVDPGDLATPSQALFSIVEADRTWIVAEVDEQDLAPVFEGQEVAVTAPAYAGTEFRGTVVRIGGEAVPQTEVRTGARIVRVRIALRGAPASARRPLKPGMEVHVSGTAVLAREAVLIPSDALLSDGEGAFVWVAERGTARRRGVRPGHVNGPETQVVSGLRPGERVVVAGKEGLRDGQLVKARAAARRS